MFYKSSFVVLVCTLKLQGIDHKYLKKLLKLKFYFIDLPVSAMIG